MNTLKAGATYVESGSTDHGIRYVEVAIPAVGKGEDVKIRVLVTKFVEEVLGSCTKGANLLIIGRLYMNRAVQGDWNYYLIPTKKIQVLPCPIQLNDITVAGGYWLSDNDIESNQRAIESKQERHNFSLLTSAPQQALLSHTRDDAIKFSITAWKIDADRILKQAHKGRQMLVEGYLRSYNGYVSVTLSSGLHTMFGSKEKKKENDNNVKPANAAEVVIQGETKEEIHI